MRRPDRKVLGMPNIKQHPDAMLLRDIVALDLQQMKERARIQPMPQSCRSSTKLDDIVNLKRDFPHCKAKHLQRYWGMRWYATKERAEGGLASATVEVTGDITNRHWWMSSRMGEGIGPERRQMIFRIYGSFADKSKNYRRNQFLPAMGELLVFYLFGKSGGHKIKSKGFQFDLWGQRVVSKDACVLTGFVKFGQNQGQSHGTGCWADSIAMTSHRAALTMVNFAYSLRTGDHSADLVFRPEVLPYIGCGACAVTKKRNRTHFYCWLCFLEGVAFLKMLHKNVDISRHFIKEHEAWAAAACWNLMQQTLYIEGTPGLKSKNIKDCLLNHFQPSCNESDYWPACPTDEVLMDSTRAWKDEGQLTITTDLLGLGQRGMTNNRSFQDFWTMVLKEPTRYLMLRTRDSDKRNCRLTSRVLHGSMTMSHQRMCGMFEHLTVDTTDLEEHVFRTAMTSPRRVWFTNGNHGWPRHASQISEHDLQHAERMWRQRARPGDPFTPITVPRSRKRSAREWASESNGEDASLSSSTVAPAPAPKKRRKNSAKIKQQRKAAHKRKQKANGCREQRLKRHPDDDDSDQDEKEAMHSRYRNHGGNKGSRHWNSMMGSADQTRSSGHQSKKSQSRSKHHAAGFTDSEEDYPMHTSSSMMHDDDILDFTVHAKHREDGTSKKRTKSKSRHKLEFDADSEGSAAAAAPADSTPVIASASSSPVVARASSRKKWQPPTMTCFQYAPPADVADEYLGARTIHSTRRNIGRMKATIRTKKSLQIPGWRNVDVVRYDMQFRGLCRMFRKNNQEIAILYNEDTKEIVVINLTTCDMEKRNRFWYAIWRMTVDAVHRGEIQDCSMKSGQCWTVMSKKLNVPRDVIKGAFEQFGLYSMVLSACVVFPHLTMMCQPNNADRSRQDVTKIMWTQPSLCGKAWLKHPQTFSMLHLFPSMQSKGYPILPDGFHVDFPEWVTSVDMDMSFQYTIHQDQEICPDAVSADYDLIDDQECDWAVSSLLSISKRDPAWWSRECLQNLHGGRKNVCPAVSRRNIFSLHTSFPVFLNCQQIQNVRCSIKQLREWAKDKLEGWMARAVTLICEMPFVLNGHTMRFEAVDELARSMRPAIVAALVFQAGRFIFGTQFWEWHADVQKQLVHESVYYWQIMYAMILMDAEDGNERRMQWKTGDTILQLKGAHPTKDEYMECTKLNIDYAAWSKKSKRFGGVLSDSIDMIRTLSNEHDAINWKYLGRENCSMWMLLWWCWWLYEMIVLKRNGMNEWDHAQVAMYRQIKRNGTDVFMKIDL